MGEHDDEHAGRIAAPPDGGTPDEATHTMAAAASTEVSELRPSSVGARSGVDEKVPAGRVAGERGILEADDISSGAKIPAAFDDVLAIGMAKHADDRFADVEEPVRAVSAAAAGEVDPGHRARVARLAARLPWSGEGG